jgi:hypothetical protein
MKILLKLCRHNDKRIVMLVMKCIINTFNTESLFPMLRAVSHMDSQVNIIISLSDI